MRREYISTRRRVTASYGSIEEFHWEIVCNYCNMDLVWNAKDQANGIERAMLVEHRCDAIRLRELEERVTRLEEHLARE